MERLMKHFSVFVLFLLWTIYNAWLISQLDEILRQIVLLVWFFVVLIGLTYFMLKLDKEENDR